MIEEDQQNEENDKLRLELSQAYKRVFLTDDGKKILKDLSIACGEKSSSVNEGVYNPYQTMFAEGKRRIILRINSMIERKENG
jgi:hypothetical protein